jgi:hypothetical protein
MHSGEIRRLGVHVPPSHLKRAVTEDALEPEHIPAIADVVQREGVPQRVKAEAYAIDPKPSPHRFHFFKSVALEELSTPTTREYEALRCRARCSDPFPEHLATLNRDGYLPLLLTLSMRYADEKVIEVHIAPAKAQSLIRSKPRI